VIYIIDDDRSVLRGFQMLLKSAGLTSKAFDHAEIFLESWTREMDDVLILDMHMTGMNGCTLLKNLEKKDKKIPVIVVTAYDEMESRDAATTYGAEAYLTKPVDSDKLLNLLRKILNKEVTQYNL
jgi:FixJ family two-component response regulator